MSPVIAPAAKLFSEILSTGFYPLADAHDQLVILDPQDHSRAIPSNLKNRIKKHEPELTERVIRDRRLSLIHLDLVWQCKELFPPCRQVTEVEGLREWCLAARSFVDEEQALKVDLYLSETEETPQNASESESEAFALPEGW